MDILATPLGLAVAFILWMTLTTPKISSKWWAKLGRWLCIGYAVVFAFSVQQVTNEKANDGRRLSDAHAVTEFTKEISRLVAQGKNQQAKKLLDQFNEKYYDLTLNRDQKSFIDGLTQTAKRN